MAARIPNNIYHGNYDNQIQNILAHLQQQEQRQQGQIYNINDLYENEKEPNSRKIPNAPSPKTISNAGGRRRRKTRKQRRTIKRRNRKQ